MPITTGIITSETGGSSKGTGTILGINYKIPAAVILDPLIGAEYVKGSQNYTNFDFTSDQPFAFYDIRGSGYQVSYTQPLASGLTVRIGYEAVKADHTNGLFGVYCHNNDKVSSVYAKLRADF